MALLVDTSSVKFYTGITTTTNDDLIATLVPITLTDITNYCNNTFIKSTMYYYDDLISFTSTNGVVTSDTTINFSEFLMTESPFYVLGSIFNDGYLSASAVGSTYINTNETINTESSSSGKFVLIHRVEFPDDLQYIASKMIKYQLDSQDNNNVSSERLGDHSISYITVGGNSYPKSVVGGLNKYRKLRML